MTGDDDFYARLGVPPDASPEDIRRAFRRRAMEWHPDRNRHPDATRWFREIAEAYECLRDPASRAAYDASHRADEPPPPSELDRILAEANASLRLTPEMLVAFFNHIDAMLRRAFG